MIKKIISFILVCVFIISAGNSVARAQNNRTAHDDTFFKTQYSSIEKYNKLLDKFKQNRTIEGKKGALYYDDYYGGSYINDSGELVVLLTNNTDKNKAKIKDYTNDVNMTTKQCTYSYNQLMEVINTINNNIDYLNKNGVILDEMYDDVWSNKVIIAIRDLNNEKEKVIRGIIDRDFMVIKSSDKPTVNGKLKG